MLVCEAGRYLAGEITIDEALDRMADDILIAYPDVKEETVRSHLYIDNFFIAGMAQAVPALLIYGCR